MDYAFRGIERGTKNIAKGLQSGDPKRVAAGIIQSCGGNPEDLKALTKAASRLMFGGLPQLLQPGGMAGAMRSLTGF